MPGRQFCSLPRGSLLLFLGVLCASPLGLAPPLPLPAPPALTFAPFSSKVPMAQRPAARTRHTGSLAPFLEKGHSTYRATGE